MIAKLPFACANLLQAAMSGRRVALSVATGAALYGAYRLRRDSDELPHVPPPPGTLLAELPGATRPFAVCAGVAPHLLGASSGGSSNYARIDEAVLRRGVQALGVPDDTIVTSPFGAESLVLRSGGAAWAAASAREPRWVGDEQAVLLWLSEPSSIHPALDAVRSRSSLRSAISKLSGREQ